jgi:sugar phosphate isomerase/epimerase
MYSGLRFEDDAQFEREFAALRDAANRCRDRGVQLLYHNHDWEFADDGRIINALLEVCGDELGFCPDIGWIVKGGADPVATLDRMGVRVGAIHFKDFASEKPDLDTVMLGEGIAPLKAAADWARKNRPGLWLIAEQDEADIAPEEAIRRNARFMQETVKSIGEDTQ